MAPHDAGIIIDEKRSKQVGAHQIHEDDLEDLDRRRAELEAKGIKVL